MSVCKISQGDSNAVRQPNEDSRKQRSICTLKPFVMKPSLGNTKKPPRSLQETTSIRHDALTVNLIVILRIRIMPII